MTTSSRFHADVVIVLGFDIAASSPHDADARARRMALGRQRIQPGDIKNLVVTPATVGQDLDRNNLRIWQETEALRLGTVSQRQRWDNGCLPEDELLDLARKEIFKAFALCPRRTRKTPSAIRHPVDADGTWLCVAHAVNGTIPIEWSTNPDPSLNDLQWKSLQRLHAMADQVRRHEWMKKSPATAVRIHLREHRGKCMACQGATVDPGALVEIDWAGRLLTREYAL